MVYAKAKLFCIHMFMFTLAELFQFHYQVNSQFNWTNIAVGALKCPAWHKWSCVPWCKKRIVKMESEDKLLAYHTTKSTRSATALSALPPSYDVSLFMPGGLLQNANSSVSVLNITVYFTMKLRGFEQRQHKPVNAEQFDVSLNHPSLIFHQKCTIF